MKRKVLIFLLVMALAVGSASAQLGSGIVYDPTNYHNALLRYYQLQQHLVQLQQTYAKVLAQYNLALSMAKFVQNMPARYRALFSQWRNVHLAQHLWEYRLLDQRHQFRPAPQHQHRLPEVHNPTAPVQLEPPLRNG